MKYKVFLMIFFVIIQLPLIACESENHGFTNHELSVDTNDAEEVVESNDIESTQTKDAVLIATLTHTPTPLYTENLVDDGKFENIKNISNKIYFYKPNYEEKTRDVFYQFYYLDFSQFDNYIEKDISKLDFYFQPSKDMNYLRIVEVRAINEGNDLIFAEVNGSTYDVNLYHYNVKDGSSNIITQKNILNIQIPPIPNRISYLTEEYKIFITDINGYGIEYASSLKMLGEPAYSPNGKYLAFTANQVWNNGEVSEEKRGLYLTPINEPDNSIVLNVLDKNDNKLPFWYRLTWSTTSSEIYFIRGIEINEWYVCKMDINTKIETCYSDYPFRQIDSLDVSGDELVVISGKMDNTGIENELFVFNPRENKLLTITDTAYSENKPIFIGDGNYILYQRFAESNDQIFITDVAGSFHKQLTYCDKDCVFMEY